MRRAVSALLGTVIAIPLLAVALPSLAHAATGTAYIRINQLGYSATAKRAYLMASTAETGAAFSVINSSGTPVYSSPIGANLGSWSSSYPDVYALDFGSVTAPGTYTISVTGPARRARRRSASTQRRTSTPARWRTRFPSTKTSGTARLHPFGAADSTGAPQRRERDDLPDPELKASTGGFSAA